MRDMACLLDVDRDVVSWTTLVEPVTLSDVPVLAHLKVEYPDRRELLAVGNDVLSLPDEHVHVARSHGYILRTIDPHALEGHRLENARELIRYAKWTVSLSDRVRLLALLDQEGSLPLADCMSAILSGRDPIAAIAALCLHFDERYVSLRALARASGMRGTLLKARLKWSGVDPAFDPDAVGLPFFERAKCQVALSTMVAKH